eukprot:TRINITY_DN71855_c0_g1_i1.p1 TRINITY_DN71855_c0_g1~~TRINITY_DN71855_c0_g1_i1.p1  ORF type:complete len:501 (+),score=75.73 TRINITY_DN71855_c0_g1_i1:127-1503(+)
MRKTTIKPANKTNVPPKGRCITAVGSKRPPSRTLPQKENIPRNNIPSLNKGKKVPLATARAKPKKVQTRNEKLKKAETIVEPTTVQSVVEPAKAEPVIQQVPVQSVIEPAPSITTEENTKESPEAKPIEVVKMETVPEAPPKVNVQSVVEANDYIRYRRKIEDSPGTQKRIKQMQIFQEELKQQIEEKRIKKELEKKKLKEEAEREERRIENEKKELALKFQGEDAVIAKKQKKVPKEVRKIFEPSEENSFAVPTPLKTPEANSAAICKQTEAVQNSAVIKEYERRIKQLEMEKENALKTALMYKEQLMKERERKGKCTKPLEIYEESLASSTKFILMPQYTAATQEQPIKVEQKDEEYLNASFESNSDKVENTVTEVMESIGHTSGKANKQKSKRYFTENDCQLIINTLYKHRLFIFSNRFYNKMLRMGIFFTMKLRLSPSFSRTTFLSLYAFLCGG